MHTWMSTKSTVPDTLSIDAVPLYSHEIGQLVGIKTVFMELVSHYTIAIILYLYILPLVYMDI